MTDTREFFNLDDTAQGIKRSLAEGLDTRIFVGDQSMLSIVSFAPGAEGSLHSHPEEQWGLLLEGDGIRTQDGKEFAVKSGDFWLTPGGIEHTFKAGLQGARVLDFFAPARESYKKSGSGF